MAEKNSADYRIVHPVVNIQFPPWARNWIPRPVSALDKKQDVEPFFEISHKIKKLFKMLLTRKLRRIAKSSFFKSEVFESVGGIPLYFLGFRP